MSSEIENFREAVAKFDELQIELELVKEGLEKNFGHYKDISIVSLHNMEDFKNLTNRIELLQDNISEITKMHLRYTEGFSEKVQSEYNKLYSDSSKEFISLQKNLQLQIKVLKSEINGMVKDAVSNVEIDTQHLEIVIQEQVERFDVSGVEDAVTQLHQWLHRIKLLSERMENRIEGVNSAVSNINRMTFTLSYSVVFSILFTGLVLGFFLATYFKLNAISDFYFSEYEAKQSELERDVQHLNKMSQWLLRNNIKVKYGYFSDVKSHYISLDDKDTKEVNGVTSIQGEGKTFIFIRDLE